MSAVLGEVDTDAPIRKAAAVVAVRREVDELWRRVERALLNRIARRDADYMELHEDYLQLEQRCNVLMGVIRRQAARDRAELLERRAIAAANDCATQ